MDSPRSGPEKLERFRDFFNLQHRFAEAVAEKTSTPMADAVLLSTNLQGRFGLGDARADGAPGPAWQEYVRGLEALATHPQRADWTQTFYARSPEEPSAFPDHVFGCFEFHAGDATDIVRLHFYNRDALGPLSRARGPRGGASSETCSPISKCAFRTPRVSRDARGFTARKPIGGCFPKTTCDRASSSGAATGFRACRGGDSFPIVKVA